MTSTSFNVGLTGATRNSSKVLKPPGGGSSDIFGSTAEHIEPQRKARSHLTSSIFTEETSTPARKPGNDSFYNLFGTESSGKPVSAVSDKSKNNIIPDDSKFIVPDAKKVLNFSEEVATPVNGTRMGDDSQHKVNSDECKDSSSTNDDTCDAAEEILTDDTKSIIMAEETVSTDTTAAENGTKSEAPVVNGTESSTNSAAATPAPAAAPAAAPAPAPTPASRTRVPPGGFSSGLW